MGPVTTTIIHTLAASITLVRATLLMMFSEAGTSPTEEIVALQLRGVLAMPLARLQFGRLTQLVTLAVSGQDHDPLLDRQLAALPAALFDLAIPIARVRFGPDHPVVALAGTQGRPVPVAATPTAPHQVAPLHEAVALGTALPQQDRLAVLGIVLRLRDRPAASGDRAASMLRRRATPAPATAPPAAAAVVEASVVEAAASAAVRPTQAAAATAAANAVTNS